MQRSILVGGDMSSRIDQFRTSECESIVRSEFDALLATRYAPSGASPADDLLEWIEDCDPMMRFVPELSDETYKNAA
jgi:hypothetical protein